MSTSTIVLISTVVSIVTTLATQFGVPRFIRKFRKPEPKLGVRKEYNCYWTEILSVDKNSSYGINRNITVSCEGDHSSATSIRMLDQSGEECWSERVAISPSSERCFWCGPDVYTVEVRLAYEPATTFGICTATYGIDPAH